jgi:tetratricopeptide (TPR) repeat protein
LSGGYIDREIPNLQAEVHLLKSEYAEARDIFSEIIRDGPTEQNQSAYPLALLSIAQIDVMTGASAETVHKNLDHANNISCSFKYPAGMIVCDMVRADFELRENNTQLARFLFQKCLSFSWGNTSSIVSFCLEKLANGNRWGRIEFRWPVAYIVFARKMKERLALHKALLFLGDVFSSTDDTETAQTLFTVALEGFTSMDVHQSRAQSMVRLGDLAKNQGKIPEAVAFWRGAQPLFKRSMQPNEAVDIANRLASIAEDQKLIFSPTPLPEASISEEAEKLRLMEMVDGEV